MLLEIESKLALPRGAYAYYGVVELEGLTQCAWIILAIVCYQD